jgi:hypothetical protein
VAIPTTLSKQICDNLNFYYWYAAVFGRVHQREIRGKFGKKKSRISSNVKVPETEGRRRKVI